MAYDSEVSHSISVALQNVENPPGLQLPVMDLSQPPSAGAQVRVIMYEVQASHLWCIHLVNCHLHRSGAYVGLLLKMKLLRCLCNVLCSLHKLIVCVRELHNVQDLRKAFGVCQ